MIIFTGFQGLENFYIKFKDFPDFSRICTNPVNAYLLTYLLLCSQQTLTTECSDQASSALSGVGILTEHSLAMRRYIGSFSVLMGRLVLLC